MTVVGTETVEVRVVFLWTVLVVGWYSISVRVFVFFLTIVVETVVGTETVAVAFS